jgi:hypothetical protein
MRDPDNVTLTDIKVNRAKHYLKERGLVPFPIGRYWSRPYTPPAITVSGGKLQEALLNGRVHRPR